MMLQLTVCFKEAQVTGNQRQMETFNYIETDVQLWRVSKLLIGTDFFMVL